MSLHSSTRHLELARNLGVVTALQKQFDNLLFARPKPNGLLRHHSPQDLGFAPRARLMRSWDISRLHSIHDANLRLGRLLRTKSHFHRHLQRSQAATIIRNRPSKPGYPGAP
jgi:hypothetical protein